MLRTASLPDLSSLFITNMAENPFFFGDQVSVSMDASHLQERLAEEEEEEEDNEEEDNEEEEEEEEDQVRNQQTKYHQNGVISYLNC